MHLTAEQLKVLDALVTNQWLDGRPVLHRALADAAGLDRIRTGIAMQQLAREVLFFEIDHARVGDNTEATYRLKLRQVNQPYLFDLGNGRRLHIYGDRIWITGPDDRMESTPRAGTMRPETSTIHTPAAESDMWRSESRPSLDEVMRRIFAERSAGNLERAFLAGRGDADGRFPPLPASPCGICGDDTHPHTVVLTFDTHYGKFGPRRICQNCARQIGDLSPDSYRTRLKSRALNVLHEARAMAAAFDIEAGPLADYLAATEGMIAALEKAEFRFHCERQ
ncbi:MAG: hypothetical protein KDE24_16480 [Caldilinea sp.]|nr:hypothetical protein [Caldilinea sp.]